MMASWLKQTPAAYYYDFSLQHCSAIVLEVKLRWAQLQGPVATGPVPGARVEGKEQQDHPSSDHAWAGVVLMAGRRFGGSARLRPHPANGRLWDRFRPLMPR